MIELMVGGLLLICLGMLLGATSANQLRQSQLRRQAEERRRLNNEWAAIRAVYRQQAECPCCAFPLYEQNRYFAPTSIEERPDDDCVVVRRVG